MSKKPLLSEGTARKWAKYAGIQNESKALIEGMYKEEALEEEALEENLEEELEENLEEDKHVEEAMRTEDDTLEEADVLAELEEMLDEAGHEGDDMDPMDDEDEEEDKEDEEEDELDLDAEEAEEADDAAMMSQADVEAAVKAGLEAMAAALGDALKVNIAVTSGDADDDMADDEEVLDEMGHDPKEKAMDYSMEEGHGADHSMEEEMYEGLDRDDLVEAVMKRVVARLVKETKED